MDRGLPRKSRFRGGPISATELISNFICVLPDFFLPINFIFDVEFDVVSYE